MRWRQSCTELADFRYYMSDMIQGKESERLSDFSGLSSLHMKVNVMFHCQNINMSIAAWSIF